MLPYDIKHGDCMELLRELPDNSVQMVLSDLPYGTTRNKWDCPLDLAALWREYSRICAGAVVLTAQTPFDKVLGASNLADLRYEWVWEKGNASGHLNAKRAPMKAHENVLVFYRKLPTYNPQMTDGHERKTARRIGYSTNYGEQRETSYDSTQRYPRSVLFFSSDKQKAALHPTQKPVALMEYLIRTYTNPGDVVLDNCMGSGTTGVAALRADRRFIGMELHEPYFAVAADRIGREALVEAA
ncbi:DNA-methyltransferase [Paraburkholderia tropica]|uniref:DNA-methyltransferase n=1 Tax=Paraburkholderia tropica TaxID=92647 RepID=UPI002AB68CE4|nr:site-specific DNA-methyltransferase [Paraburkholderia tropica]